MSAGSFMTNSMVIGEDSFNNEQQSRLNWTDLLSQTTNLSSIITDKKQSQFAHDKEFLISLGKSFPNVYLTEREAQCALLLMLGFTSKESAQKLHLSSRTIEYYQLRIKAKLNMTHRATIIMALLKSDFIKNMNRLFTSS